MQLAAAAAVKVVLLQMLLDRNGVGGSSSRTPALEVGRETAVAGVTMRAVAAAAADWEEWKRLGLASRRHRPRRRGRRGGAAAAAHAHVVLQHCTLACSCMVNSHTPGGGSSTCDHTCRKVFSAAMAVQSQLTTLA